MGWCSRLVPVCALALLAVPGCTQPPAPALDAGKVASVAVGRSARTEVFAALGRPARTERGAAGETWIYEAKGDQGGQGIMGAAGPAMGVAGAFVPYLGLFGSGIGLASSAAGGMRRAPDAVSLAVSFGSDGIVRDCVVSSTALPAGVAGSAPDAAPALACQRPLPSSGVALPGHYTNGLTP